MNTKADIQKQGRRQAGLVAALVVGLCSSVLSAQTSRPADAQPQYIEAQRVPEQLLRRQPRQVLVLPSEPGEYGEAPTQLSSGAVAKLPAETHRLPDGYIIAAREARIDTQGDWYIAHVARVTGLPDVPPLRILPNKRLTTIEAIEKATQKSPTLVITGRVTEFRGVNYFLAENLVEPSSSPERKPAAGTTTAAENEPAHHASSVSSVTSGDTATKPAAAVSEPRAEDIVAQLMATKPVRAVVLPEHMPKAVTESAPAGGETEAVSTSKEGPHWPEETMLIDRVGRIVPGERWWSLTFEDRGMSPSNRPIRLLPNRLLEDAIAVSGAGTRGVVFVISGEVTEYQGQNYLLLRKVLVRRDFGNFR